MKNKFLLLITLAILTLTLCACTKDSTDDIDNKPSKQEDNIHEIIDESDNNESNVIQNNTANTDKNEGIGESRAEGIAESSKETSDYAENIIKNPNFEIIGELESSEYVIYTLDGGRNCGICDIYGRSVVDPVYTLLGWCPWHEVVYAEPFYEDTEPVIISDKYKIDLHYGHGGFGDDYHIYDVNRDIMYIASIDMDAIYLQSLEGEIASDTPYILYNGTASLSDGEYYPYSDAKNTYNIIENLIFGSAEYEFINRRGSTVSLGVCERVDEFINDYMLVKRDGKIGFVNLSGKDACEFVYTDAMHAYNSKAWVKSPDGIWTVVRLR